MADETTTSVDTTTSPSEQTATEAVVATTTEAESTTAETSSSDTGTVLGDEVTGEEDGGAQAPEETEQPAAKAPEKYELAMEGVELDATFVEQAEPVLRELDLSNDDANKLLPVAAKMIEQTQERVLQTLVDAGAKQRKDWLDAFAADPDIGGANREDTEHLAAKGMDALGFAKGHPFRVALTESGFGNHPDMIRTFRALGQMVGEDGAFVRSNDGVREAVSIEKRLYPND